DDRRAQARRAGPLRPVRDHHDRARRPQRRVRDRAVEPAHDQDRRMSIVPYTEPLPDSLPGDELELGPRGWSARRRAAAALAGHAGDPEFVPVGLRGNRPAIAAAILYGAEVGLEPMQALAKVAVIKGRPSLSAEAQRALVYRAGHELWFDES